MPEANNVEKVIIIGSGPAGWTAAIYAARANLNPLVLEGDVSSTSEMIPGGQLMFTTEVENYPGFPNGIDGTEMMKAFRDQALRFGVRVRTENVTAIDLSKRPFVLTTDAEATDRTQAVIIATGASANWLGLESEQYYRKKGLGVTACATCDGAFPRYRDKPIAIIGGGDSAMEESLYMTKFAGRVHVIHRRDELRASKIMQKRILEHPKITVEWNSVVDEVLGNDQAGVTGLKLKDTRTGEFRTIEITGMFLSIGHTPNTKFLNGQLPTDAKGYLKLADPYRSTTAIEGVFAAGDVVDSVYRQAITAAGMGCKAAIDAERWLADQGIE
ncbi:MAG TPA: thioredoxin-disulfide reductase [Phycisphaerae bacterium]|nr:thioredoxin-disulfide reductase [Phycisphaerae bacterium]